MDQANSQRDSHENSDLGPGLPDFPKDLRDRSREDVYPSRPSSRLAFNRTILSTSPPEALPDSDAVQWSHSLFQKVGISDLRLPSIKPQLPTKPNMAGPPPPGCQVENIRNEALFPLRSQNPTNPDCGTGPNAFARSQVVPRKSPKSSPPSVSRLCFPFVTTSSPRRNKQSPSPPPPPRHKYSCFPTLMSPVSPGRPAPRHQRHNYRQHGYSRLALVQVKWFWSLREEELQGHSVQTRSTAAEGDVPLNGNVVFPPLHSSITGSGASTNLNPLDVATVYPRFGDIKALRDPYCVRVDEHFIALPPWTIRKTLWMFDLLRASERRALKHQIALEEDPSDVESESEQESSSASTTYGDDSDTTLVESESEADLTQYSSSTLKVVPQAKIDHEARYAGPSSIDISALQTILESGTWCQSTKFYVFKSRFPDDNKPSQWATNWYQRWAILMELSRLHQARKVVLFNLKTSARRPSIPTEPDIPGRRFFFMASTSDSDDEDA